MVADFIKSAGCQHVVRVLGRQTQKWASVTRNKTVRAVRSKADNTLQVGLGCYRISAEVYVVTLTTLYCFFIHAIT